MCSVPSWMRVSLGQEGGVEMSVAGRDEGWHGRCVGGRLRVRGD
jgi:hypothetical protein